MQFTLKSNFQPSGDQPEAITSLEAGIKSGARDQVLLGVTGSGKTFTMANVIRDLNMPTLIISHNKTLAGQLYQEMRDFFPDNAVSYFVSYYDYYQPEAYVPSSDTYIEKEATINERIDKLRLQSTTNIMTRNDVIVVASVSCIYNIGDPKEYGKYELPIYLGLKTTWAELGEKLIGMQYDRSDYEFSRGSFRVRGYTMDIYPAYQDVAYRIEFGIDDVTSITAFDPVSGKSVPENIGKTGIVIFPAKLYLVNQERFKNSEAQIRIDLDKEANSLKAKNKLVEAQRLMQRTNYDLETLKELGSVNGIENYSRYFDGRKSGERPFCLPDFFRHAYGDNWLCIIDESHMTVPQIRGMFNGDQARKHTLIDYGFRLEAAIDNRPLKWDEFYDLIPKTIYVSATPNEFELDLAKESAYQTPGVRYEEKDQTPGVIQQLVRPTGIVDPEIEIRSSKDEIQNVIEEIKKRALLNERVLVTTLTKKTAEDLSGYLIEQGIRAKYLHSDVKTLERTDILDALRKNEFDVLIGVNLLREGLDLPEVTLVAILDADREGFLRSRVSLIQTMGRAARNIKGEVILYAETITGSMKAAIEEIRRRRNYQLNYNQKHSITPETIVKPLREKIVENDADDLAWQGLESKSTNTLMQLKAESLAPTDREKWIKKLERDMKKLAGDMQFELAIQVRDKIRQLKGDVT
ncbi:MAG: excinuclease ABC subunit UvrB [Microgenomates group bacterium]